MSVQFADTPDLRVAYHEYGPGDGWPVILSHGFPYDPGAFDNVQNVLVDHGARVIIPYLRGFGPTRVKGEVTGEQAALGLDVIELMDALQIEKAIVAGFDWGGLASTVAAALLPQRAHGLVSLACYDIIDRKQQLSPVDPSLESLLWYQHLFQRERGRQCLEVHRDQLCKLLWKQWSPTWSFGEIFDRTKASFANPDFVSTVIHTYRYVMGTEDGLEQYRNAEKLLDSAPDIVVPSITIDGHHDALKPGGTGHQSYHFTGQHEHWTSELAGHALPYEDPEIFAKAVLQVKVWLDEERVS